MLRLFVVAILVGLVACSSSSSSGALEVDASSDVDVPATCPPAPGSTGNSKHVGAYCTPNGGECSKYSSALACSVDLDPRGKNFCILLPCKSEADCGEDACCTGDPGNPVHACVPILCVIDDGGACPAIP